MSKVSDAVIALQRAMDEERIDPRNGLPLDLFEFSTTLFPFINVDLFVLNDKKQVLLSWRSDQHYGTGWQLPGGIICMMETIDERIQKTAMREIGCEVEFDHKPIAIYENIILEERKGLANQLERAHNIALLYRCRVPDGFVIDNKGRAENEEGYLHWFDNFPENLLECHKSLRSSDAFREWFRP